MQEKKTKMIRVTEKTHIKLAKLRDKQCLSSMEDLLSDMRQVYVARMFGIKDKATVTISMGNNDGTVELWRKTIM